MVSAESEEKDENKEALVSDLHAKNNASTMTEKIIFVQTRRIAQKSCSCYCCRRCCCC